MRNHCTVHLKLMSCCIPRRLKRMHVYIFSANLDSFQNISPFFYNVHFFTVGRCYVFNNILLLM